MVPENLLKANPGEPHFITTKTKKLRLTLMEWLSVIINVKNF